MFDLLKSDNLLVRYAFAAAVVWGGLFFATTVGFMPLAMARFLALIAFGWFILRNAKTIASRLS